jgi:hypothetical protein
MTSYEVGSIVYLLNKDTLKIIPSIIKEEIIKKTVKSVSTQYVLELPDKSHIQMESIKESVFKDIAALREFMLENTRKSVEKLIQNAIDVENSIFGPAENSNNTVVIDDTRVQSDIKSVIINSENTINKTNKEEK